MKNLVVGSMSEWSGMLKDFFRQIADGSITKERLEEFLAHRNPFEAAVVLFEKLIKKAQRVLSKAFDKLIAVESVPAEFTEENLAKWAKYNLRPVYLPDEEISEDRPFRNWVKPEKWFYSQIGDGKISENATKLKKGWYLADFTLSADYNNGTQVFQNDPLAPLIIRLRREGRIGKYDSTPMGSRFAITNDEWRNVLLPELAKELGFKSEQVRLERVIEFNAIGNLYDKNRGKFNAWEWFDDRFEDSRRLCGGDRDVGGFAFVSYRWSVFRFDSVAGRPLVSF